MGILGSKTRVNNTLMVSGNEIANSRATSSMLKYWEGPLHMMTATCFDDAPRA